MDDTMIARTCKMLKENPLMDISRALERLPRVSPNQPNAADRQNAPQM